VITFRIEVFSSGEIAFGIFQHDPSISQRQIDTKIPFVVRRIAVRQKNELFLNKIKTYV